MSLKLIQQAKENGNPPGVTLEMQVQLLLPVSGKYTHKGSEQMPNKQTEITVSIDLREIESPIGFINQHGNRILSPWDVDPLLLWIDRKLTGTNGTKTTILLKWEHCPAWLATKLGQYLDSKANTIIIDTPRMQQFYVKGGVI